MKWKQSLYVGSIISLLFVNIVYAYESHFVLSDGNVLLYGGIQLKPNSVHTYIPQMDARYKNVTLDSGTLRLSKGLNAYEIKCSTNDNITISLSSWFYERFFTTTFTSISETETSLSFEVNTRERGEPTQVTGALLWSFNNETSILSLTCANMSTVSFQFRVVWELDWFFIRMPVWMGIFGGLLMVVTPVLTVFFLKSKEYEYASIMCLLGFALGFAMLVAWLWG